MLSALKNCCLGLELETDSLYPQNVGPTLAPSSSKLGTCQGKTLFTLAYALVPT